MRARTVAHAALHSMFALCFYLHTGITWRRLRHPPCPSASTTPPSPPSRMHHVNSMSMCATGEQQVDSVIWDTPMLLQHVCSVTFSAHVWAIHWHTPLQSSSPDHLNHLVTKSEGAKVPGGVAPSDSPHSPPRGAVACQCRHGVSKHLGAPVGQLDRVESGLREVLHNSAVSGGSMG